VTTFEAKIDLTPDDVGYRPILDLPQRGQLLLPFLVEDCPVALLMERAHCSLE
jgi:hypothetical protein